jgi:predicted ATPase
VVERTGGVPLFVEELTRAVLDSGDARLSRREIPATLQDSLMARLDRLGPAKEVIQIAAVIGNEFSYELVHAVHPIAEEDFRSALRNLTDADLLYVRGVAPDARYQFKHALIRDAAYEALLKSRRKDLHGIVARTIDKRFADLKDAHPELLAHHWAEAGEAEPAISTWQKAAESALDRGALAEAESQYRNALRLLDRTAECHSRDRSELRLQMALGEVLIATKGYRSDEKVATFDRARKLAEKLGAVLELVWVHTRRV